MSTNPHIVDAAELRERSGLTQAAAIKKWASAQGFKVLDGGDGPWTTIEAINKALGLVGSSNEPQYRPEQLV